MNYSIKQIRIFVAVAETLSLTRASERCFITIPAVSKQLRNLEAECNVKLFETRGKQLFLTEKGSALLPEAKAFLASSETLSKDLQNLGAPKSSRFKIHMTDTYQLPLFSLIRSFRDKYPLSQIELDVSQWLAQNHYLVQHDDRLHILGEPQLDLSMFHIEHLRDMPLCLVAHSSHPLAQLKHVSPAHLSQQSWVVSDVTSQTQTQVRQILKEWQCRNITHFHSLDSVTKAMKANLGIGFLPDLLTEAPIQDGWMVKLPVDHMPTISIPLVLAYHRNYITSEMANHFINHLKTCLAN